MNVLSLFDGMSCGQIALNVAGVKYDNYYACEIKKHAIETTQHNYPNTIQMGSVIDLVVEDLPKIDLLIGGSPCQDLTVMGMNRDGLKGSKSILFYEFLRVKDESNPTYFFFENVASMKNSDRDVITKLFETEPILINSSLFSAQERRRYYWTNIDFDKSILDKGITIDDIVDRNKEPEETMSVKKRAFIDKKKDSMYIRIDGKKSLPITARGYSAWNTQFITSNNGIIRDLTLDEYKKLQTVPLDYEFLVSKSKATDLLGDGWTVDLVSHVFEGLSKKPKEVDVMTHQLEFDFNTGAYK